MRSPKLKLSAIRTSLQSSQPIIHHLRSVQVTSSHHLPSCSRLSQLPVQQGSSNRSDSLMWSMRLAHRAPKVRIWTNTSRLQLTLIHMSRCSLKEAADSPPKKTISPVKRRIATPSFHRSTSSPSLASSRNQSVSKICAHLTLSRLARASRLSFWASREHLPPTKVLQQPDKLCQGRVRPRS